MTWPIMMSSEGFESEYPPFGPSSSAGFPLLRSSSDRIEELLRNVVARGNVRDERSFARIELRQIDQRLQSVICLFS